MSDSQNIVEVQHLSHKYSVDWAVRDISFSISRKGIMGLLGSNGAGKSTTMNIICGVLNQTEGTVLINGIDLRKNPVEAKKYIGFLPQKPPLHPELTVEEFLTHCAVLRRVPAKQVKAAVEEAMEKCSITHFRKRLIKNLSGGYQQRVGIAQAIVHRPPFVVLDEPTNGLDPNQIVEIRNLVKEIARDRAVLISTHNLAEVQVTCDDIRMIDHGRMVFEGTIEEFDNYVAPASFTVRFAAAPALEELAAFSEFTNIEDLGRGCFRIRFEGDASVTEKLVAESCARGWQLQEISLDKTSLDTIFAKLSGKLVDNNISAE